MKSCPQCGAQYPDSEEFCAKDGGKLVADGTGRVTTVMAETPGTDSPAVECPVCGGRAQPGEVICNFCGTRLAPPESAAPATPPRARVTPETFIPAHDRVAEPAASVQSEYDDFNDSNRVEGRGVFGLIGFVIAAIIALAPGAWLALYLSEKKPGPVAQASPTSSPSPALAAAPSVDLARNIPIQVSGDLAGSIDRDLASLRKTFEAGKDGLTKVYASALSSDGSTHDGMLARLRIMPDGSVAGGAVRVSTAPNPSLDAEVIRTVSEWKFPAAKGGPVDVDFPILFARSPTEAAAIESDLSAKLASLAPNETPEYAFAPSTPPAAAPTAASPPPEMASAPSPAAPAIAPAPESKPAPARRRPRRSEEMASTAPPARMRQPPLSDRVATAISANRRLRRVQTFTSGSAVTLSGKVFDDNDKRLAERIARGVSGVTTVNNYISTSTGDWARTQARIQQELQNAGLSGVNVRVIGNSAYLSGQVKTDLDRQRAATVAEQAAPVKVRVNLITVAPGSMFGF
ncbi:MAG TPA: BON domain-containing protein [Candidatus Binataceae bacterium]|nr:BON domain-containing protein [Candidatus Binataceae bacterium]